MPLSTPGLAVEPGEAPSILQVKPVLSHVVWRAKLSNLPPALQTGQTVRLQPTDRTVRQPIMIVQRTFFFSRSSLRGGESEDTPGDTQITNDTPRTARQTNLGRFGIQVHLALASTLTVPHQRAATSRNNSQTAKLTPNWPKSVRFNRVQSPFSLLKKNGVEKFAFGTEVPLPCPVSCSSRSGLNGHEQQELRVSDI